MSGRRRRTATGPGAVMSLSRRERALRLRAEGRTFAEIGAALGISRQGAAKLVGKAMAELRRESAAAAEDLRALECKRLDMLLCKMFDIIGGDGKPDESVIKAAREARGLIERRARLLGLDMDKGEAETGAAAAAGDALAAFSRQLMIAYGDGTGTERGEGDGDG